MWRVTYLNNSQGRHQGHTNTARQVAGATELCRVAPTIGGSCVRNLVHVTHLAHGILRWLLHVWKICAPLGHSWQKGCWAGSFDCISGPPGFFFICFIVCTTGVSPVGISRGIYRICFYVNVFMYVYLHNCFFSF